MKKIILTVLTALLLSGCAGTIDNAMQANFLALTVNNNTITGSTITEVDKQKLKGM